MIGSDIIWGQVNTNGSAVALNRYASAHAWPAATSVQSVEVRPHALYLAQPLTSLSSCLAPATPPV